VSAKRISSISGKELIKLLETAGWQIERVRGSHHIMRKADASARMVVVPVHGRSDIPIGTLTKILKQAGLSRSEFERLLKR